MTPSQEIIDALRDGGPDAADRLFPVVYEELRRIAASHLGGERPGHTLQATALVHEAYIKLVGQTAATWNERSHFVAVAAEAIRRVLIDHARRRGAQRRGGDRQRVELTTVGVLPETTSVDIVALDEALERLKTLNPRHAEVAHLRFFGGLSGAQIAEVLGVDRATVVRDWTTARAWLSSALDGEVPGASTR